MPILSWNRLEYYPKRNDLKGVSIVSMTPLFFSSYWYLLQIIRSFPLLPVLNLFSSNAEEVQVWRKWIRQ
jgi:hypothetical protein